MTISPYLKQSFDLAAHVGEQMALTADQARMDMLYRIYENMTAKARERAVYAFAVAAYGRES